MIKKPGPGARVHEAPMREALARWLRDQAGQDTVEYALILAFVVLSSAALYLHNAQAISGIWSVTGNNLEAAKSAVS
jgi:Flp pilus assembly pilin Flp